MIQIAQGLPAKFSKLFFITIEPEIINSDAHRGQTCISMSEVGPVTSGVNGGKSLAVGILLQRLTLCKKGSLMSPYLFLL